MERYYSDDQDKMFEEAKIVPPSRKIVNKASGSASVPSKAKNAECEICFLSFPKHVSCYTQLQFHISSTLVNFVDFSQKCRF